MKTLRFVAVGVAAIMFCSALVFPGVVGAQSAPMPTSNDVCSSVNKTDAEVAACLESQIGALLGEISGLQSELAQVGGGSGGGGGNVTTPQPGQSGGGGGGVGPVAPRPSACVELTQNLKIGDRGPEVSKLIKMLVSGGYGKLTASDVSVAIFGEKTAAAVVEFQEKYASEVLTPFGLAKGTGYVGKYTREKLNQLYGCSAVSGGGSGGSVPTAEAKPDVGVSRNPTSPLGPYARGATGVTIAEYTLSAEKVSYVSSVTVRMGPGGSSFQNLKVFETTPGVSTLQVGTTQATLGDGQDYTFQGLTGPGGTTNTPFGVMKDRAVTVRLVADVLSNAAPGTRNVLTKFVGCRASNPSGDSLSCGNAAGADVVVAGQSVVQVSLDSGLSPAARQVEMGSTNVTLAAFRFTEISNVEDVKITDFTIYDTVDSPLTTKSSFYNLRFYKSTDLVNPVATAGVANVTNSGSSYYYDLHFGVPVVVPQSGSITLVLKGDVASYGSGGATENKSHVFSLGLFSLGSAVGATSNNTASVRLSSPRGNPVTVVRTLGAQQPSLGTSSITIVSPTGGTYRAGDSIPVTWTSQGIGRDATISFELHNEAWSAGQGFFPPSTNDGFETLYTTSTLPTGTYNLWVSFRENLGQPRYTFRTGVQFTITGLASIAQPSITGVLTYASDKDYAGQQGQFRGGVGANGNANDWLWGVGVYWPGGRVSAIKSITVTHDGTSEAWSTSNALINGNTPYPIVVIEGNAVTGMQLNYNYNQTIAVGPGAGTQTLLLYGQMERTTFAGGTVTVVFEDNTSVRATLASYSTSTVGQPSIAVLSPLDGATHVRGTLTRVGWRTQGLSGTKLVSIDLRSGNQRYHVDDVGSGNEERAELIDLDHSDEPFGDVPDGVYTMTACINLSPLQPVCDTVEGVKVVTQGAVQPSVTVSWPTFGTSVSAGEILNVKWATENVSAADVVMAQVFLRSSYDGKSVELWRGGNDKIRQVPIPAATQTGKYEIDVVASVNGKSYMGTSGTFSVTGPTSGTTQPTLISVSPESGSSGTNVVLIGSGFIPTAVVNLCGAEYKPVSVSADGKQIVFVVPEELKTKASLCTIYVSNKNGTYTNQDKTFRLTSSVQPSITVLSPNGGETFMLGQQVDIRWSSSNVSRVSLDLYNPNTGALLLKNLVSVAGNPGNVSWTIPSYVEPGRYWLRVGTCLDPLVNCNTSGSVDPVSMNGVYDGSDEPFLIINIASQPMPPTWTQPAPAVSGGSGTGGTGTGGTGTGGGGGSAATQPGQTVGGGGSGGVAGLRSIEFTANPAAVVTGDPSTLALTFPQWAFSCSAPWNSSIQSSGSYNTGALTATKTYTVSCKDASGNSESAEATVYVGQDSRATIPPASSPTYYGTTQPSAASPAYTYGSSAGTTGGTTQPQTSGKPVIYSLSPSFGLAGTVVTVTGINFTSNVVVTFTNDLGNGTSFGPTSNGTSFTFTVPNFVAGAYYVKVDNYSQLSDPIPFTLTASGSSVTYNYAPTPQASQLGSVVNSLGTLLELLQKSLR